MNHHPRIPVRLRLGEDRLIFAGLLAVLIWLPWPRGAHTGVAEAGLGMATGILQMAWAVQYLRGQIGWPALTGSTRITLCLWGVWIFWTLFPLVPLSASLLMALSPASAEIQAALRAIPHAQARGGLSIAPGETFSHVLLTLAYFGLYLLTVFTATSRKRQRLVLLTLVGVGLVQAVYAIQRMYGGIDLGGLLDIPPNSSHRASGSFINPNHFAAYLELILAAGLGLILADLRGWTGGSWRSLATEMIDLGFSTKFRVRVFLIAIVVGLVLSQSRMGNVAFFSALCVCGAMYVLMRQRRWIFPALLLFISVIAIDIWIVSDRFGLGRVVERIQKTDVAQEGRALVLADLAPAFENYAATGAGLGAFEAAYSPYKDEAIQKRYDHAHNEYAEFLIESGLVGLGILALWAGLHLLHAIKIILKRRDPARTGVAFTGLMALTAMLLHSSGEFLLRIPAIAATLIVLMAMVINISAQPRIRTENSITDTASPG